MDQGEQLAAGAGVAAPAGPCTTLNRGVLITPFHDMALVCPDTTEADVDLHTTVFHEVASALLGAA